MKNIKNRDNKRFVKKKKKTIHSAGDDRPAS